MNFEPDPDEPISVVPFPELHDDALQGLAGQIVTGVEPYTEAHPAAILVQLLAEFGIRIGRTPHMFIANGEHPARINPLIIGKTSDGAKGTGYEVSRAVYDARVWSRPLTITSGLSSGEGLIEAVRDGTGTDPNAKDFDEGVHDKRLLVVEPEFTSTLAVMERTSSILPRIVRQAYDGENVLRTMTRKPLTATEAHIGIIGHVTPGELKLKLTDAQLVGGTMNRFMPAASRRTRYLPDGGNVPDSTLSECNKLLVEAVGKATEQKRVQRTNGADRLWRASYPRLRRSRPDGPVASMLARSVPNTLRLSLAYALLDSASTITEEHLVAALALWRYVEDSAEWLFGIRVDSAVLDSLMTYIAAGGRHGRSRNEIREEHYQKNKTAAEITSILKELIKDGRARQETVQTTGRPATRFYAC